jgi:NADH:ubiquinone oxidoreductase subunit 5 (subunit L)/multisubunit Na+/H+ antiporter MnhA subunit
MEQFLPILLILPLAGLIISQLFDNKEESVIYWLALLPVMGVLGILLSITSIFLINGAVPLVFDGPVLYQVKETEFGINFFLDAYSLVYLLVSTAITALIIRFSRTYMHRERGYKRFFSNVLFFYLGLLIILLANSIEILFVGWEILGVTSFFLIGFYRERYLPVKNALKVVSLYRIADIALLLGIWICHHYFGYSIHFSSIEGLQGGTQAHILNESFYQFIIPFAFLLAAMVKSAQFPFSSWVPRAMEGPTTSSSIFYGSLSIHIGVFLMIRTAPLWEDNLFFHLIIGAVGLITTIVASLTARVQPSIKVQIAYSSIAQIGLMFIWVALGWYWLAIIHFSANAFLRAYQLLVSPSVLSYRIHDLFYHFKKPTFSQSGSLTDRLKATAYVLGIKEFGLDNFMFSYLWQPLKRAGNLFGFMEIRSTYTLALPLFLMGLYGVFNKELIPDVVLRFLPEAFAFVGLIFILKAFVERKSALNAWVLIMVNQLFQSLTFSFNEEFEMSQVALFLSGILISTMIGIYCINKLRSGKEEVSLHTFHGHSYEHPRLAFLFAIACLGLAGFPITPSFIGEDLMLGHIHENQFPLLALIVLNIILDGLVIFRIYSRLFTGPHTKGYHEVASRSS